MADQENTAIAEIGDDRQAALRPLIRGLSSMKGRRYVSLPSSYWEAIGVTFPRDYQKPQPRVRVAVELNPDGSPCALRITVAEPGTPSTIFQGD